MKAGELYHDKGIVFATPMGEPVSPDSYSHAFKARVGGTEFEGLTIHGLRHSHASQLLRSDVHVKVVSERLGHSTVAFTMDRYAKCLPGMDQEAADAIGKTLG